MNKKIAFLLLAIALVPSLAFGERNTGGKKTSSYNVSVSVDNVKGANISISGKGFNQSSQGFLSVNVPAGDYVIEASSPGYSTERMNVKIGSDQKFSINLKSVDYNVSVSVNSKDSGFRISVTGNGVNQTANDFLNTRIPAGNYTLEISKNGYETFQSKMTVSRDEKFKIDMRAMDYLVNIMVNHKQSGFRITLMGNGVNQSADDYLNVRVPAGNYTIEVSNQGFATERMNVTINRDEKYSINPKVQNYRVSTTCNVKGAEIAIYEMGNRIKVTGGMAGDSFSLAYGLYDLVATAPGYEKFSVQLDMRNSDQKVNVDLKPSQGTVIIIIGGEVLNKKDVNARSMIQIYDNGQLLDSSVPAYSLKPGQHTIQIISGGLMAQTTLNIQAGQTYQIEPVMTLQMK